MLGKNLILVYLNMSEKFLSYVFDILCPRSNYSSKIFCRILILMSVMIYSPINAFILGILNVNPSTFVVPGIFLPITNLKRNFIEFCIHKSWKILNHLKMVKMCLKYIYGCLLMVLNKPKVEFNKLAKERVRGSLWFVWDRPISL